MILGREVTWPRRDSVSTVYMLHLPDLMTHLLDAGRYGPLFYLFHLPVERKSFSQSDRCGNYSKDAVKPRSS
eukprot:SAG31_NODE_6929_length_1846_cov_17.096165_2_plen_72_part_00